MDAILGQRFRHREGKPAWHKKGRSFNDNPLFSEAVGEVTEKISIREWPVIALGEDGERFEIPDQFAVIREPVEDDNKRVCLGLTTKRWHQVSYVDLAKNLDELSKTYGVETVGLIDNGGLCFGCLRGPDFEIKGDEMNDYFIVNLSQVPGQAHRIFASPRRVVCRNTNLLAASQSTISLSISHSANAGEKIKTAGDLVAKFKDLTRNTQEIFTRFAETDLDAEAVGAIFERVYAYPTMPAELRLFHSVLSEDEVNAAAAKDLFGSRFDAIAKAQDNFDKSKEKAHKLREAALECFEGFEPNNLRGTAWAAYNACTEVADWREGRGDIERSKIWGDRAKEKRTAFQATLEVIESL